MYLGIVQDYLSSEDRQKEKSHVNWTSQKRGWQYHKGSTRAQEECTVRPVLLKALYLVTTLTYKT